MQEVWKDVDGYEGIYKVSNLGRVKSAERLKKHPSGTGSLLVHEKILHQSKNTWGYSQVTLYARGHGKNITVHRLVAESFIPNPNGLPQVNHKDECKSNNHADNLEWCTNSYNMNYGTRNLRGGLAKSKPVIQFSLDGKFISKFCSAREASKMTGADYKHISDCCLGIRKTHKNYIWKFA